MRSLESTHAVDHAQSPEEHGDAPARLPRKVARKAAASGTGNAVGHPDTAASFADAINAGIHGPIARKGEGDHVGPDAASLVSAATSSTGSALPSAIQRKFESSLGADLSSVRVHTGDASAAASSAISARAYTLGQDIHFAAGQYDPSTPAGEHLLAHEVAHTVQQAGGAVGAQCKLEVSEPGDALEIEADRAADAMVSGQVFRMSSGAGVQRSVMRTPGDDTTGERDAAPTSTTDGGGPASDGDEASEAGPQTVATTWTIDYDRVYRGAGRSGRVAPGERTDASILHVHEFRVQPDSGEVTPNQPFSGYQLQNSGRVTMGVRQHPRGEGGQAAASISYQTDGDVHLRLNGEERAMRAFGGRRAIANRVRAAFSRQSGFVEDPGAAATALLTDEERAAGITVAATVSARRDHAITALPLHYGAIGAPQTMHVMVQVPTGERRVTVDNSEGFEDETSTGTTAGQTDSEGSETEMTTEVRTALMSSIESSYRDASERIAREVVEQMRGSRRSWQQQFELGGQATSSLSGNIGASINAGMLASLIPGVGRALATLLSEAGPEIQLSLTPQLQLQATVTSRTTLGNETSSEDRNTHETQIRTATERALTQHWEQRFETALSSTVRSRRGTERTTGSSTSGRRLERGASTSRSEGAATAQRDQPRLVLTNAPAAGGGEAGGQRGGREPAG